MSWRCDHSLTQHSCLFASTTPECVCFNNNNMPVYRVRAWASEKFGQTNFLYISITETLFSVRCCCSKLVWTKKKKKNREKWNRKKITNSNNSNKPIILIHILWAYRALRAHPKPNTIFRVLWNTGVCPCSVPGPFSNGKLHAVGQPERHSILQFCYTTTEKINVLSCFVHSRTYRILSARSLPLCVWWQWDQHKAHSLINHFSILGYSCILAMRPKRNKK